MPRPQSAILPEAGSSAWFLVLKVAQPAKNARAVARAAAGLPKLTTEVARMDPKAGLLSAVAFGPALWRRVSPGRAPKGLRPFKAIGNGALSAPATGGDLLVHIHSNRPDLNFELAMRLRRALGPAVRAMDEVQGFRYLDARDLTGFIDGTENPKGAERAEVALVGEEDAAFAGGSFVIAQRYVHDLAKFGKASLAEQEGTIGRRKKDSVELSDKKKPASAHIARVVIEEDGEELEIVRHSFPYGTTSEHGLFFIAYNKTLDTFEKMLRRMFGVSGDGLHDHLMDFTRAVSGGFFFAPSLETLAKLAR